MHYIAKCKVLLLYFRVVICGGDGSFNECMNGVFEYTQKSANIDYNNPEAKLQTCRIPIAHIPTGKLINNHGL